MRFVLISVTGIIVSDIGDEIIGCDIVVCEVILIRTHTVRRNVAVSVAEQVLNKFNLTAVVP